MTGWVFWLLLWWWADQSCRIPPGNGYFIEAARSYYTVTDVRYPDRALYTRSGGEAALREMRLIVCGLWRRRIVSCKCRIGYVPARAAILLNGMTPTELLQLKVCSRRESGALENMRSPF